MKTEVKYIIQLNTDIELYENSSESFIRGNIILSNEELEVNKFFTYVTNASLGNRKMDLKAFKKVQKLKIANDCINVVQTLNQ